MNENDERNEIEIATSFNYYLKEKWKLTVTVFCLFSFVTMGTQAEISGSTMLSLGKQVGIDYDRLGWIVASRSIGFLLSAIIFGVIFQSIIKKHCTLLLSLAYILPAIATGITPYLKSFWSLLISLFIQGLLHGISDLAVNTLVTKMWKENSTAPLNSVYLGYPLGALLSILIVGIFRENVNWKGEILIGKSEFQKDLVGPYLIVSIFCLISSMGFGLITFIEYRRRKKENIDKSIRRKRNEENIWKKCSPTTCGQGFFIYGFILISFLFFFNFFFGGIEQGFTKFFTTFIEKDQNIFDKNSSIYPMISYWLTMFIGRILFTFLTATWLSPQMVLTICLICLLLTYCLWIVFLWLIGLGKMWIILLITFNGLSISSISPTLIGWIKQYLTITPMELTVILISNSFGGILFSLFVGWILKYFPSKHLFTLLIFAVLSCFIFFLLIIFIQKIHLKKISSMKKQNDKTSENLLEK